MKRVKLSCIVIFMLSVSVTAAQDYIVKNYNISDGLTQSTVNYIMMDTIGFVWIGTNNGLSRFDGKQFINYKTPSDLFNYPIVKMEQTREKDLLLLTKEEKLWIFNGEKFNSFMIYFNNKPLHVKDFVLLSSGLLINCEEGLFKYINKTTTQIHLSGGADSAKKLVICSAGVFIIGCNGVYSYSDGSTDKIFSLNGMEFTSFHKDSRGIYWAGIKKIGLCRYSNGKWTASYRNKYNIINEIKEDVNKTIWFSSQFGLFRTIVNSFGEIYNFMELQINSNSALYVDKENTVWFGSTGNGLYKLKRNLFENHRSDNISIYTNAKILLKDSKHRIWVGIEGVGCLVNDMQRIITYTQKDGLAGNILTSATETKDGKILISSGKIIQEFKYGRFYNYEKQPPEYVKFIYNDSNNTLWVISLSNNIFYYKNGLWNKVDLEKHFPINNIKYIYESGNNTLWFASDDGLLKWNEKTISKFNQSTGLISNQIHSITSDNKNRIWAGTQKGVSILSNDQIVDTISIKNGLLNDVVFALGTYKDKMLIGTSDGLSIYENGKIKTFTSRDGINSNEINPCKLELDSWGMVNIGTTAGYSLFQITRWLDKASMNNAYINRIITENDTLKFNHLKGIDSNINHEYSTSEDYIHYDFNTISYNEDNIQYRYRIENNNYSEEWKYTDINRITLDNFSAGKYNLHVQIKSFGDNWKPAYLIPVSFYTPFYKSKVFLLTTIIILIISSYFYSRHRKMEAEKKKYKTSSLSNEKAKVILNQLRKLYEEQEIFIDSQLTLTKLSVLINSPKEHISQVINTEYKLNFNDLTNKYRIEKAKRLLDQKNSGEALNVIQTAYEVGFNSKSSFNTAFKKFTNLTPTEYKKQNIQ